MIKIFVNINFDSNEPIYEQLKREIIVKIAQGQLKPGDKLPSVRKLGDEIGINLHTVNKTYNILKEEGYVRIDRRVGTVLNEDFKEGKRQFKKELNYELKYLIADSINRGIKKEEFLSLVNNIYKEIDNPL